MEILFTDNITQYTVDIIWYYYITNGNIFHTFIDSSAATNTPNWQKLRSSLVICLFIGLNPAKKRNDVTGTRLLEPRMINVLCWNSYWAKHQEVYRYWLRYTYQQTLCGYYLQINEYFHALKARKLLLVRYHSFY